MTPSRSVSRVLALPSFALTLIAIATSFVAIFAVRSAGGDSRYALRFIGQNHNSLLTSAFQTVVDQAANSYNTSALGNASSAFTVLPVWWDGDWVFDLHYVDTCINLVMNLDDGYYSIHCTPRDPRQAFSMPEYILDLATRPLIQTDSITDSDPSNTDALWLANSNFGLYVYFDGLEFGSEQQMNQADQVRAAGFQAATSLFDKTSNGLASWVTEPPLQTSAAFCLLCTGLAMAFVALLALVTVILMRRLDRVAVHAVSVISNAFAMIFFIASAALITQQIHNLVGDGFNDPFDGLIPGFQFEASTSMDFRVLTWLPVACAIVATVVCSFATILASKHPARKEASSAAGYLEMRTMPSGHILAGSASESDKNMHVSQTISSP